MKIQEIEMISDVEFPQAEAAKRLPAATKSVPLNDKLTANIATAGNVTALIITDSENNIAAYAGFSTYQKVWVAKNIAVYPPYTGSKLAGHIYKFVKTVLGKSIQSDSMQTQGGRILWSKTLPSLGLKPMMFDTKTERILSPDLSLMYPPDDSADLYRYQWILERNDRYPSQNLLAEDSLIMPYTGLWYNPNKH